MSAVDAPPGVAFAGIAAGEFTSRVRGRRLAKIVFYYVSVLGVITLALARRHIYTQDGIEVLLAAPIMFIGVGILGYAVRAARLRVDVDGVRWGWDLGGFRMARDRLARIALYPNALALSPKSGSTWYLASRDWHRFEDMGRTLRKAGIAFERQTARAPLRAHLQSFGYALDILLVANAVGATFAVAVAFAL